MTKRGSASSVGAEIPFGHGLKDLRLRAGLTQSQLASRLGVQTNAVGQWESGETFPKPVNLVALARVLNVSADRLLSIQPAADQPSGDQPNGDQPNAAASDMQLLQEARRLGIDLRDIVQAARGQRWREENRDAIADANAFIERHGLWSDGKRLF